MIFSERHSLAKRHWQACDLERKLYVLTNEHFLSAHPLLRLSNLHARRERVTKIRAELAHQVASRDSPCGGGEV